MLHVSDDCYCTPTGIFAPDITSFCNSISVTVYMKVSGTLVDASSHCKDMTGVSYHCYVCLCLHAHVSLGQETITDTSKYTYYMATTCLSLIFQTWLSQDHARLTMIPVNLTVPVHLCCNRTPDVALAVTNWSQPVKGRHNQVEAVVYCYFTLMASTLLCLLKVFWMGILCTNTAGCVVQ